MLPFSLNGMWHSWLARLAGGQEVEGSSPSIPTAIISTMRPTPTSLVDMKNDCPLCFGTGTIRGQHFHDRVTSCPNGCHWSEPGSVFGGTTHPQVLIDYNGRIAWVDRDMAFPILEIWKAGIDTWVSCQGGPCPCHEVGNYEPYIGLVTPCDPTIAEEILLKFNFHVTRVTERDWIFKGGPGDILLSLERY